MYLGVQVVQPVQRPARPSEPQAEGEARGPAQAGECLPEIQGWGSAAWSQQVSSILIMEISIYFSNQRVSRVILYSLLTMSFSIPLFLEISGHKRLSTSGSKGTTRSQVSRNLIQGCHSNQLHATRKISKLQLWMSRNRGRARDPHLQELINKIYNYEFTT